MHNYQLSLYHCKVQAGFPSPVDDYMEEKLDLNKYLITHPTATFLVRVAGNYMHSIGIKEGDILIVDKSVKPISGKVVVAIIDGRLMVKKL